MKIKNILTESNKFIESYEISCLKKWGQGLGFNPSSWQQKKFLLNQMGYSVKSSDKKEIVKYQKDSEFIQKLLRYSELSKLNNAFVKPLLETKTLPYIHTTYSQIAVNNTEDSAKGIRTGRLSSSAPNLQQIPARTDLGKELREIFIPISFFIGILIVWEVLVLLLGIPEYLLPRPTRIISEILSNFNSVEVAETPVI